MAYFDLALLTQDTDFDQRITACAASEGIDGAARWTAEHKWEVCAAPGFADAYATALLNEVPQPGRDQSVISDGQLLSAVQGIAGAS